MLQSYFDPELVEAGCDEAGRGCLAGPVFAAAVILRKTFRHPLLNDSKQLTAQQRRELRCIVKAAAVAWAVASVDPGEIDEINILKASFLAMHRALDQLNAKPELILVDGNRFTPYPGINHKCIVKGDSKYMSIAAASILAKTYRDDYMENLADEHPQYGWLANKGYPTKAHRQAIMDYGPTPYHRRSFRLLPDQTLF
jgi:ribonuclease HII